MARHSLDRKSVVYGFVPPSASLGVFGHPRDSCGFVSPRNRPPPEPGTLGSFIYLPVRWRAILFPHERAKAVSSRQVLVWAFWGMPGTRADSCRDGIVRHPRVTPLAASYTFPSDGAPFSRSEERRVRFRPTKC